ncbi:MAG: wax ester/triacylglycerol synthase family O-acyltransferase [Acidobacteriota bacterium]|nr:MAG: wax ester/triacylglycerol synthase family O-acyltransferase [Acidobacteriota bacterium]
MVEPTLNRRLSSLDAAFLNFEKKEATMHIGSVSVFEGEVPFEDFVRMMDAKLHLIPRYQQIVAPDPFNLAHPTWEFDPNFDIRNHIFRLWIEAPGGERELSALAGRIFTPMMDRNKPLWDIHLVYGLEGGRTAMICRVHHCMVDGISGVDLLKIVLDFTPEPPPLPPKREQRPRERDPARRLFDSILGGMQEGMNRWLEFQNGLLNLTQLLAIKSSNEELQRIGMELPRLAAPVWPMPFNGIGSGERLFVWNTFSFAEARAIRGALEGTVNDVVLTALTGAVSRYVAGHGRQIIGRTLRVMVPVSLRQEDQRGALGNLVSLLPIEIPLDLADPIERFRFINRNTSTMKSGRIAEGLNIFSALLGMLPASVQTFVGSLATANLPIPPVNIISTNVPGPQVPLYARGRRMIAYYPYVPIGFGIGCGCAIMSYDQNLYFGISADAQTMPDVERLRDHLYESFHELRRAAGVEEIKPRVMKATAGRSARSRAKKENAGAEG